MTLGARCAAEAPEGVSISAGRTCGFAAKIFGSADPDREGSPGSRSPEEDPTLRAVLLRMLREGRERSSRWLVQPGVAGLAVEKPLGGYS